MSFELNVSDPFTHRFQILALKTVGMKKNLRALTFVLTAALLSASLFTPVLAQTAIPPTTPPTTPEAPSSTMSEALEGLKEYKCAADVLVGVEYGADFVDITFKEENFTLEQKESASGLQYKNTEEKLVWFTKDAKGDEGYLEKDGAKVADACTVVLEAAMETPTVPVPSDTSSTTPPADTSMTPPATPPAITPPVTPPAEPTPPVVTPPVEPTPPVTSSTEPAVPVTPPADPAAPVTPPAEPAAPVTPPVPDAAPVDLSALEGTVWSLYYLTADGKTQSVPATARPTLGFAGGKLKANTGCNDASGDLTAQGTEVEVGALVSTEKACTDPAAQQLETDLLAALEGMHTPTVRDYTGGLATLTLRKEDGTFLVLVKNK